MKILNLYAGIGGNRQLWGDDHEITAVEYNQKVAQIYQKRFPRDKVLVEDAHEYLLNHFREFDFIWSSPPCPTHSRMNFLNEIKNKTVKYPDMKLYQEIILLKHFFKGKFVVENVVSYYDPLILPIEYKGHYYWANFVIPSLTNFTRNILPRSNNSKDESDFIQKAAKIKNINLTLLDSLTTREKRTALNNMVEPEAGLRIFRLAFSQQKTLEALI